MRKRFAPAPSSVRSSRGPQPPGASCCTSRNGRHRSRLRGLQRPRAGCIHGVHQPGRHDAPRRQSASAGRATLVRRCQVFDGTGHVAGTGWRQRWQPDRMVSRRRDLHFIQRFAGSQAGPRDHRELRPGREIRQRVGGSLLHPGIGADRPLVPALGRVSGQRQAVGRGEPECHVRHTRRQDSDQQYHRAGRPVESRRQGLGVWRERRPSVRIGPANAFRPHLQLAGQSRLHRETGVPQACRPECGPCLRRAACSMPTSTSGSRFRRA